MPNDSCPAAEFDHSKDDGAVVHGSRENPVKVEETRQERYVEWEYERISRALGFSRRCSQALLVIGDKQIDRIVVREANRAHHVFYFDVTEQMIDGLAKISVPEGIEKLKRDGKIPKWVQALMDKQAKSKK